MSQKDIAKLAEAVQAGQGMMLGLQDYEGKDEPKGLAVHRGETTREARAPKAGGAKGNHFHVEDASLISLDAEHVRKCECLSETFEELVSHHFHHTILQG